MFEQLTAMEILWLVIGFGGQLLFSMRFLIPAQPVFYPSEQKAAAEHLRTSTATDERHARRHDGHEAGTLDEIAVGIDQHRVSSPLS